MDFRRFEERVRKVVPEFILKQFYHLLPAVPETYRYQFIELINKNGDVTGALNWVASSAGASNKPMKEYIHQRMQDNMSEIMD
jgi:hypothetical protein